MVLMIGVIAFAVWSLSLIVILALCTAASRADAVTERAQAADDRFAGG